MRSTVPETTSAFAACRDISLNNGYLLGLADLLDDDLFWLSGRTDAGQIFLIRSRGQRRDIFPDQELRILSLMIESGVIVDHEVLLGCHRRTVDVPREHRHVSSSGCR